MTLIVPRATIKPCNLPETRRRCISVPRLHPSPHRRSVCHRKLLAMHKTILSSFRTNHASPGRAGFLSFALVPLAFFAIGCGKEEIESYVAPRPVEFKEEEDASTGSKTRMLAAMVPASNSVWFFKLEGPEATIASHKADFDAFLASVKFNDQGNDPISWTTPKGWRQEAGAKGRHATLVLESKENPLELTITALPEAAGDVSANVNRWRRQLGLAPALGPQLAKVTTERKVGNASGITVDFLGTKAADGMMSRKARPKMAIPEPRDQASNQAPVKYTKPEGWKELPPQRASLPGTITLEVADGSDKAKITITPLAGQAGGLKANVDRWRGQVNLPPADEDQLKRDVGTIEVGGKKVSYVDLKGPEQRMLVAIVPQGAQSWYFKILGPVKLIEKEKKAFEAFVKSARFQGDSDG